MPKGSRIVGDAVASRANGLDSYARRMESLHNRGLVSLVDLHRVYAGAFLGFATFTERSIERLFLGHFMGRFVSGASSVRPLAACQSERVARAVVRGERRYVDWLPYWQTEERAEAFFSGGKPFTSLPKPKKKAFEDMMIIRNAIAHESSHALRRFRAAFVAGKALTPADHRPSTYLRGQHAAGQTRFNYLLSEVVAAMKALSA